MSSSASALRRWWGVVIWNRDRQTPPCRSGPASGPFGVKQTNHPGGAAYQPRTSTTTLVAPSPLAIEMVPFGELRDHQVGPDVARAQIEVGGGRLSRPRKHRQEGVLWWGDSRAIHDDRSGIGGHSGQSGHVQRQGSALPDGFAGAHVRRALGSGVTDSHWGNFSIELGSGPAGRAKIPIRQQPHRLTGSCTRLSDPDCLRSSREARRTRFATARPAI